MIQCMQSNSISNNFVKFPFPGPISPNPISCKSISSIEISVCVRINHVSLYTPNASGILLDISESPCIVFNIYSFSLM